ncbi:hypothetical protein EBR44_14845, partial [bacterium]|nr:hypothetical protein [bacterium]
MTGGVVSVSSDAKLGANPGAVTATSVTLNGGALKATATFTLSTTRGITLGSSHGTIEVVTGATVTYDGVIAGASANLTKTGAGTLTLGGTNTYSGSTTIGASGGVLRLAGSGSLGSGTYSGAIAIGASGELQIGSTGAQVLSGNITGSGGLSKDTGVDSLTLSGTNSYSGSTTISTGTVIVGSNSALGASSAG